MSAELLARIRRDPNDGDIPGTVDAYELGGWLDAESARVAPALQLPGWVVCAGVEAFEDFLLWVLVDHGDRLADLLAGAGVVYELDLADRESQGFPDGPATSAVRPLLKEVGWSARHPEPVPPAAFEASLARHPGLGAYWTEHGGRLAQGRRRGRRVVPPAGDRGGCLPAGTSICPVSARSR